jgi:hypothetical protein
MKKFVNIFFFFVLIVGGLYAVGFLQKNLPTDANKNTALQEITYNEKTYVFRNLMGVPEIFKIKGQAKGSWFFEASFPIEIQNQKGDSLKTFIAQATSDWMTENYVPFVADIDLSNLSLKSGNKIKIIFHKDNPSGDASKDDFETYWATIK